MLCPFCGHAELKVVDKRDTSDLLIRRRRECENCEKRFTTYERITEIEMYVLKKDGTKEKFDREKIKMGLMLSCKKRPVTVEQIDNMLSEIEQILRKSGQEELSSDYIGNLVLEKLKIVDEVAYVRFASVFRNFTSLQEFRAKF